MPTVILRLTRHLRSCPRRGLSVLLAWLLGVTLLVGVPTAAQAGNWNNPVRIPLPAGAVSADVLGVKPLPDGTIVTVYRTFHMAAKAGDSTYTLLAVERRADGSWTMPTVLAPSAAKVMYLYVTFNVGVDGVPVVTWSKSVPDDPTKFTRIETPMWSYRTGPGQWSPAAETNKFHVHSVARRADGSMAFANASWVSGHNWEVVRVMERSASGAWSTPVELTQDIKDTRNDGAQLFLHSDNSMTVAWKRSVSATPIPTRGW